MDAPNSHASEDQCKSQAPKFDTFVAILTPGPRVSIVDSMGYAL
jgi:hypothetical protein